MSTRILLVEDERSISQPLAYLLSKEGYEVKVVENGYDALEAFNASRFDLMLLDLMLPGMPGTEVCRKVRKTSRLPIIMLTAKDSEVDIVVGLELGADDYVTKPYSSRELLARIQAVLRRMEPVPEPEPDEQMLASHGVVLDLARYQVSVNGAEVKMPLREFELLEMLMRNSGRVLTRTQLIEQVWGFDYYGDTKTLDVHIKRIRSRIEPDPSHPQLITTVRGVGYRFG